MPFYRVIGASLLFWLAISFAVAPETTARSFALAYKAFMEDLR